MSDIGASVSDIKDLKQKTVRGGIISLGRQATNFLIRIGSMVVLARLLLPADYGLFGMVTVITGFFELFKNVGLSMATIQRASISQSQTSTLFWINFAVGVMLAALCTAIAPAIAAFYGEPRLYWVTVTLGVGFVFSGAAAQHRALLVRSMRYGVLAFIDITSLILSTSVGIGMAVAGKGYWSLVVMAISQSAIQVFGVWLAAGWIPGMPQRGSEIKTMLKFGGTLTLNNFIVYVSYNAEKVLLGRFFGVEMLGIYSRAYQLIKLPIDNLNSAVGIVAFPALSRIQNDPERLRSYFLKGYGLFLSTALPITAGCALFSEDIILTFLGSKWHEAVPVFRLLAPTIVVFALINPFSWLLLAVGRVERSLKIAMLISPVVILGYLLGLNQGPHGVAAGYSIAMVLLVAPVVAWAKRDTLIKTRDILRVLMYPCVSIIVGAAATLAVWNLVSMLEYAFLRLAMSVVVLFGVYLLMLLFVMQQWPLYIGLIRESGIFAAGRQKYRSND